MKTSKKMLIAVVTAVTVYTIASFVLAFRGIEISPTLTGAYFAFWGTEIIAMASIKNTKVKNTTDIVEGNVDTFQEEYEEYEEYPSDEI